WISADTSWRTNRTGGTWVTGLALGSGSVTISALDPVDGDFTNSPLDPVQVTAIGYKGRARQQIQVTLAAAPVPYTCLGASLCAGGSNTVNTNKITGTGIVATGGSMILASGTSVDQDVEAAGTLSGSSYFGSKTTGVTPRKMPDATVFDYFIRNGTAISYSN